MGVTPEGFVFDPGTGQTVKMIFPSKPVGLKYRRRAVPFSVVEVEPGSQAESMGVQVGWLLIGLDDVDFIGMDKFAVSNALAAKLRKMPLNHAPTFDVTPALNTGPAAVLAQGIA